MAQGQPAVMAGPNVTRGSYNGGRSQAPASISLGLGYYPVAGVDASEQCTACAVT